MDKRGLELAQKDYDNGQINTDQFINAQNTLRQTKIKSVMNELQYKITLLTLELKKGTLLKTYGIDYKEFKIKK